MAKFVSPVNTFNKQSSLDVISNARGCARTCGCEAFENLEDGGYQSLAKTETANANPANLMIKGKNNNAPYQLGSGHYL